MSGGPTRRRIDSLPRPLRGIGGVLLLVLAAAAIAWAAISVTGLLDSPEVETEQLLEAANAGGDPGKDPFAWESGRGSDFERRAALGFSHVLYELSPDGVLASAKRTAAWDAQIDEAAAAHDVDPDLIEALVFLESAGRPDVIAGATDPAGASGLAQIVASTGIDLLGMPIDLARSQQLTDEIVTSLATAEKLRDKAARLGAGNVKQVKKAKKLAEQADREDAEAERARRERIRVDARFDPEAALDGMGEYLEIASDRFGREDLAVASYHMGIGNLETVIGAYAEETGDPVDGRPIGEVVAEDDLSYAQLYFDTSPTDNPKAYDVLSGFEDDSGTYLWRALAAQEIMRLYHSDRAALKELVSLHSNKATSEEVFHPEDETETFADPGELEDAIDSGDLVEIPPGRSYGYEIGPQLGELTKELGVDRELYETLRPEALATLIYMTARVQAITGRTGPKDDLTVTSAVRDQEYQDALLGTNIEATPSYSLHTTGYSFDILRDYRNGDQAEAFQFVLDRLSALGVIDYAVEPQAIHVTVSDLARPLLND